MLIFNSGISNEFYRGIAYEKVHDHSKAIEYFEQSISLDPNYQKAYSRLLINYCKTGKIGKAIELYLKAVQQFSEPILINQAKSKLEKALLGLQNHAKIQ